MILAAAVLAGLGFLALPGALALLGKELAPRTWSLACLVAMLAGPVLLVAALVPVSSAATLAAAGVLALSRSCAAMLGNVVPGGEAVATAGLLGAGLALSGGLRALRRSMRARHRAHVEAGLGARLTTEGPFEVVVLDDARPAAFSVPGRRSEGGQIVLTAGLIDLLPTGGLELVRAHEAAHLRHRHAAYLAATHAVEQAIGFFAPARRSAAALRLALERWADEDAAGADRNRRARLSATLVAAAMGASHPLLAGPSWLVGFSSLGGLGERLAGLKVERRTRPHAVRLAALVLPGLLLGGVGLFGIARLGQVAWCAVAMARACGPT